MQKQKTLADFEQYIEGKYYEIGKAIDSRFRVQPPYDIEEGNVYHDMRSTQEYYSIVLQAIEEFEEFLRENEKCQQKE